MVNKKLQFSGKEYADHRTFWTKKLSGIEPFVFKYGKATSNANSSSKTSKLILKKDLSNILEKYADGQDLETFILLLSGLYILFYKYNNKTIVFNTPLFNQFKSDEITESYISLIQTVNADNTIKDLINEINAEVLTSYKFQDYPVELLKNTLETEKHQLSNVFLSFSTIHAQQKNYNEAYDLRFNIIKSNKNEIEMLVEYNQEVFPEHFIDNLFIHYENVISNFHNLDTCVKDINILSEEELVIQTIQFNATERPALLNKRVVELFEAQASKTPEKVAVVSGDSKLTYQQLNERSNSLAHFLCNEYDIMPNTFIGSLFEKTEFAIISLLGILKSGAAYVPIDPDIPFDRIDHIVKDAEINILLTHSNNLFQLENYGGTLLALDIQEEIFSCPSVNLEKSFDIHDAAYLIYTSGSSGKPKGVVIEHEGLANVALDHVLEFEMCESDVYLGFMSLSFDGSLLDIFTALLSGASLLLPDFKTINNTNLFITDVADHKVTVTTLTPSYLNSLNQDILASIRILVSAGEAAKVNDLVFYAGFKKVYNGYGPSETTVNVSLHKVDSIKNYELIPIGKPRANKKVFILDEDGHILPLGLIGEICVSGAGLARGYLNDQVLTQSKFVYSPLAGNKRLYKTGDLGYWTSDGNIVYIGRNDEQIKINGFRIDLGEIEKNLITNKHIKNAVVLNNKLDNRNKLVAYYEKEQKIELVPSLGEYFIYDYFIYNSMATDEMRVLGYKAALEGVVRDKIVLDPGTGAEMILARHCIAAGAKKVYAVEIDNKAYQAAMKNIEKYNLGDKIVLLLGDIKDIQLPEKIEYVVSALAGNIATSDGCIPIVNRLKQHIQYDVNFIPNKYTTFIAGIGLPEESFNYDLSEVSIHYIDQVFEKQGYQFDLRFCLNGFTPDKIVSEHGICENINYVDALSPEDSRFIKLNITKSDKINGLVCWINAFFDDVLMINSLEKTHHLPVYFPLFEAGVDVNPGDNIEFTFNRKLSDNNLNPDYFLTGKILRKANTEVKFEYSSYNHKKSFRTTRFYKNIFLQNGEAKKAEDFNDQNLKDYLKKFLPYYMVPKNFISVSTFPVNLNGKVDKGALHKLLEQLPTEQKIQEPPRNAIEKLLLEICQAVIGNDQIGINDDFFMIGGDSIKAIQIASRLHNEGYKVEVKDLFENPLLTDLAKVITLYTRNIDQSVVYGDIDLTPVQKEFLTGDYSQKGHYNQAVLLHSKEGFDLDILKAVFGRIVEHHDAFRITIKKMPDGQYLQTNQARLNVDLEIEETDLTTNPEPFAVLEAKADILQRQIDLENGPLIKLGLFRTHNGDYLLIVIHHLIIDGVSWRILFEDIDSLYFKYKNGEDMSLPLKTDSYKTWADELNKYADSDLSLKEINYWKSIDSTQVPLINRDLTQHGNYLKDTERLVFNLSEEKTQLLLIKVNRAFNTEINDILLTALAIAINRTFGNDKILVALEGHGRQGIIDGIDISRTVGWFTSSYPILLKVKVANNLSNQIIEIKDDLRRIPNKGIGYGILKYLTAANLKKDLNFQLSPQISFNYLGQFDEDVKNTFFQIADGPTGKTLSSEEERKFDFDINAMITGDSFVSSIYYNRNHYKPQTILRLSENYKSTLEEIIDYCSSQNEEILTPTDFTYKGLNTEDFDLLFD